MATERATNDIPIEEFRPDFHDFKEWIGRFETAVDLATNMFFMQVQMHGSKPCTEVGCHYDWMIQREWCSAPVIQQQVGMR